MSGARAQAAAWVTTEGGVDRMCPESNSTSGARPVVAACGTTEVAV